MGQTVWRVGQGGLKPVETAAALHRLLLAQRGLGPHQAASFLAPTYEANIHDPHQLYGMQEAVDRIYRAVKKGEHILVYGDYDADGVAAAAQMIATLRELGASAIPYLPHRLDDGYGLNLGVLKHLAPNVDLVMTVDCGVSNLEEIAWLQDQDKDVIVVDHHEIGSELPAARAVLHPRHPLGRYPWGHLCGAGVAWKLCQALWRDQRSGAHHDRDQEKWLLDLALLGTVADVMPLTDENRAIARFGLQVLQLARRPGLAALLALLKIDARQLAIEDVSFKIIPRLNAPGRLEHAQPALDLLLAPDAATARRQAQALEQYNTARQTISRRIAREAEGQIIPDSPLVFAWHASWPAGVVGLVAGQLARKFGRPAVVVGGNGRHAVGSARSPKGYNVLQILQAGKDHVLKLGGHAQAAGFSVAEDNIHDFHRAIFAAAASSGIGRGPAPATADAVAQPELLRWETAEGLQQFEPFGEGNPQPKFIWRRLPLLRSQLVGKKGDHAKFIFDIGEKLDAIGFGLGGKLKGLGDYVDVIGSLLIDRFWGTPRLQLRIADIARAGSVRIEEIAS